MLLALVLAQLSLPSPVGPIFNQPSLMWSPADFEAFPANGRGAGSPVPLANWALQSEVLENAAYTYVFGATGGTPTVTANAATSPAGDVTADRLQVPLCSGATGASVGFQSFTATISATYTFSMYVLGNGAPYSFALYNYDTTNLSGTETVCAVVATGYTRCTHTWTQASNSTTGRIGFGCQNDSTVTGRAALPASDVFAWGVMVNAGSSAAPYVKTTTVARLPFPTGAKGETLTFTRASTALGTITAGGGLATTGIANGDLRLVPVNMPRVEFHSGTLGIHTEDVARTNTCIRSHQLENAGWAAQNFVCAAVIVTANAATSPDGDVTADRLQIPACTPAVAPNRSTLYTTISISCGVATCVASLYLRSVSTAGSLFVALTADGITYTGQTNCSHVSGSWSRCVVTGTAIAGPQYIVIGPDFRDAVQVAAGATTAQDVYVWGVNYEANYLSSHSPTSGASSTRTVEAASFTPALTTGSDFSWAGSFVGPVNTSTCAGFFPYSSTAGPTVYQCFSTGFVSRASGGGNVADSPTATTTVYEWLTGLRWGVVWDRATNKTAAIDNGVVGAYGAANAGVTSTAWTAVALGGMGIHTKLCGHQNKEKCR